jgi:hypothetical protein
MGNNLPDIELLAGFWTIPGLTLVPGEKLK